MDAHNSVNRLNQPQDDFEDTDFFSELPDAAQEEDESAAATPPVTVDSPSPAFFSPSPPPPASGPASPDFFAELPKATPVPELAAPSLRPEELPEPTDAEMRELGDARAMRTRIYDKVLTAAATLPPASNKRFTLSLSDPHYVDPEDIPASEFRQAMLDGTSRARRLRGTWTLTNNETGEVVDKRQQIIGSVPRLTDQGYYVHNGNQYILRHQQRLQNGIFARTKNNGELESFVNLYSEDGPSHRYFLDPDKKIFYMSLDQAKIPLMAVLRAAGATNDQIKEAWGEAFYNANSTAADSGSIRRLQERFAKTEEEKARPFSEVFQEKLQKMRLDPGISERTLGAPYARLGAGAILAATKKLLAIHKGEADTDDRDSLGYQEIVGPEDLFAERLTKDYGGFQRQTLFKLTGKGNLQSMPSGALTKQIEAALLKSGLGQPTEGINPLEILDRQYSISKMGEGGLASTDSIPAESRDVSPSHMAFIDAWRTPESLRIGADAYVALGARRGKDGKFYTRVRDLKTGKTVWRNPRQLANTGVTWANETETDLPLVRGMRDGKIGWYPREEVQYAPINNDQAFSPIANLVPFKANMAGHRVAMASRMLTQALPLVNGEAPLVQTGVTEDGGKTSYEEQLSKYVGVKRADQAGRVIQVSDDEMRVRYEDGKEATIPIMRDVPSNAKTGLTQTPMVKAGDTFQPGQLLLKSNYSDDTGAIALGLNARVAYTSWQGKNYEDAFVISRAFADRAKSQHMYKSKMEVSDSTELGRAKYLGVYPSRFKRDQLDKLDDNGIVRVGQTLTHGDPMVLALDSRVATTARAHRTGKSAFKDTSLVWDHKDPAVVVSVTQGKNGPVVLVKSESPMQEADKLSGRMGDKAVVRIVDTDKMPVDSEGRPFDVIVNPATVPSRNNPAQLIEATLGEIAKKRGAPIKVPDFQTDKAMAAWVLAEAEKYGVKPSEDITDPTTGRVIKGVATGTRWFMKLHHMAEHKGQARGGGAYSADGTPAKGGYEGGRSKKIGLLETNALMAHGVPGVLQDIFQHRGQQDQEYWASFMAGNNPKSTKVPETHKRFLAFLQGSGINVARQGQRLQFMALTDKDVDELAENREVTKPVTVDWNKRLEPVTGGLFDAKATGGHDGCFHYNTRVLTETGWQLIGDIVTQRISCRVWSYNFQTAEFELRRVTNWFTNTSKDGLGHVVVTSDAAANTGLPTSRSLWGTRKHQVFKENGSKQDLATAKQLLCAVPGLSSTQRQLLLGGLLGVATLSVTGVYAERQHKQRPLHTQLKHRLLQSLISTDLIYVNKFHDQLQTVAGSHLAAFWQELRPQGLYAVSYERLELLDERGLSFWFLGQGGLRKDKHRENSWVLPVLSLATDEVLQLQQWLSARWGIDAVLYHPQTAYADQAYGWALRFSGQAGRRLVRLLRPYATADCQELLGGTLGQKLSELEQPELQPASWRLQPVPADYQWQTGLHEQEQETVVFDIEVEGLHNYLAEGVLVSNSHWSAIKLETPLLNPVFEEPARRLLGLTQEQLEKTIAGEHELPRYGTGPSAIAAALKAIDVKKEMEAARQAIQLGSKTGRDAAVRKLSYLKAADRNGIHPGDWVLKRVPVLPPRFRPVSVMTSGSPLVADPNYLYAELIAANDNLRNMKEQVGEENVHAENAALYNSFKAVSGLGDPVSRRSQEKQISGLLKTVLGNSPKTGMVQRKLLATNVDNVGRAVIVPEPDLDMDQVGLPEDKAFETYSRFVTRRLVRQGMSLTQAMQAVQERSPKAREALLSEMEVRPVYASRAPTWHKYGILAFRPKLVAGDAMHLNPLVYKGFGADNDGDMMNWHVPSTDKAVSELLERMLPSKTLLSPAKFDRPAHMFTQEYIGGLFRATKKRGDKEPQTFRNLSDVRKAYARGELDIDTPIRLLQSEGT